MRVGLVCKPGAKGAKKLAEKYGDRLLCVRFRYDEYKELRYKTVELIEEQTPWKPKIPLTQKVSVQIGLDELVLQAKVKKAGGKWNYTTKLWEVLYANIRGLGLNRRIVTNGKREDGAVTR